MSTRTIIVVVLAITCGVSAAVAVNRVSSTDATDKPKVEMAPVVVTTVGVPRGTTLTEEMLMVQQWPKERLPKGAVGGVEQAKERTVLIPLLQGEPLLEKKLASKEAGRGMAPLVKKGMRAVTLQTPNESSNVAGFILPGNKVDIMLTLSGNRSGNRDDGTGGGITTTLLQDIKVLAVDQKIEAPESNKVEQLRSVTVQVTERQAKMLSLAQNRGTLNLALRNESDKLSAESPPVTLNEIRWMQGRPPNIADSDDEGEPQAATRGEPQRSRTQWIRTLRGTTRGRVRLRMYPAASASPARPPATAARTQ